jgi:Beta-lactamase class C and other penicillin binding proteins
MTLDDIIHPCLGKVFTAAQLEVRRGGNTLAAGSWGLVDPEAGPGLVDDDTLFDIASVTKLFAATAFMTLVRDGLVALDDSVSSVLPEFSGERPIRAYEDPQHPGSFVEVKADGGVDRGALMVDAGQVTFRDLLCHRSGLPAWRPLYLEPGREAAIHLAESTFFSYPRHGRVVYSDIGLVLVGLSIERLCGLSIAEAVRKRVLEPLGMRRTRYFPAPRDEAAVAGLSIAATELCAWRRRRIAGEVHDENAAALGGASSHAGIFSTASELADLGQLYLEGGSPLLARSTVEEMVRLQAEDGAVRRGIGFSLWSPDPEAASNPLGRRSFGHLGFTGTSLWVDPDRELVIACLTNRVYFGRDPAGIGAFRVALHKAIVEGVERI